MSLFHWLGALTLGVLLGATPFVRYAVGGAHNAATPGSHGAMNHGPQFGGVLLMVRDHHVELVRREASTVELFVSDMTRRPVRPLRGIANHVSGKTDLTWQSHRLVGHLANGRSVGLDAGDDLTSTTYHLTLSDGRSLTFQYP